MQIPWRHLRKMFFSKEREHHHAQSRLTLCNPMDCSLPGSSVHGIFQARILEWVAISSSKGSSWFRDQTCTSFVSCIAGRFLPVESLGSKDCNGNSLETSRASLVAQLVKNPPAMRETWVRSLGWEDPLQGERLPTPVFWPGESHGLYSPWGPKESDMAEWLSLSLWRHLRKMFFSSKKTEQCAGNLFPSMWPRHLCTEADAGSYGNHPGNKEKSLETQRSHPRDWCYGVSKLASPQPASLQISYVWFITKSRLS